MTRPRPRHLAIVGVVVIVLVAAVLLWRNVYDDDPIADYCAEVEEQRETIGRAMETGPQTGLIQALPGFEKLADVAPDDIADEWQIVISSITQLRDALDDAGLDPATYNPDKAPADLSADEKTAIDDAAIRLASPQVRRAFAGVDQQVRDVCQTRLFL